MRQTLRIIAVLAIVALLILGWRNRWRVWGQSYLDVGNYTYDQISQTRYVFTQAPADPLKVAVVWAGGDGLCEGARLAEEEIKRAGLRVGHAGRSLDIECVKVSDVGEEVLAARRIARDPTYAAVIGHSTSDSAKLAAVSYETMNIPFLAVNSTDKMLTNQGFAYVFRTLPEDQAVADQMSRYYNAAEGAGPDAAGGRRGFGVFYAESAHSISVVNVIASTLSNSQNRSVFEKSYDVGLTPPGFNRGLTPPAGAAAQDAYSSRSYFFSPDVPKKWQQKIKNLRDRINNVRDAAVSPRVDSGRDAELRALILIDDDPERAGVVLSQVRAAKFSIPVFGGLGLDSADFAGSVMRMNGVRGDYPQSLPVYKFLPPAYAGGADPEPTFCLGGAVKLDGSDGANYTAADGPCDCAAQGSATELTPASVQPNPATQQPPVDAGAAAPATVAEPNLCYVPSVFDAQLPSPCVQSFVKSFKAKYQGRTPDSIQAQGYEAVWLLAQALARAASAAPVDVVSALKTLGPYRGLRGPVCFNAKGDICGKEVFVKVLKF